MDYKALFQRLLLLIVSPAKAWREIAGEERVDKLLTGFVYPCIGFCCLAVFIGSFVGNGIMRESLAPALMRTCAYGVSLFVAFYAAAYFVNLFGVKLMGRPDEVLRTRQLVGYSMAVVFVLGMVVGLIPSFKLFMWVLQFYTIKIVWEGATELMHVEEEKLLRYTVVVSLLVIFAPSIVEALFNLLSDIAVKK